MTPEITPEAAREAWRIRAAELDPSAAEPRPLTLAERFSALVGLLFLSGGSPGWKGAAPAGPPATLFGFPVKIDDSCLVGGEPAVEFGQYRFVPEEFWT